MGGEILSRANGARRVVVHQASGGMLIEEHWEVAAFSVDSTVPIAKDHEELDIFFSNV
jgi:hypothetical protein